MAEHLSMVAFTTNRKRQVCYSPWEYSSPATINNSNFSKKIRWWGKAQQGSEESQVVCWWSQETRHTLLLLLSRFSRVQLCATPQTAAHQAPLSLGFSRQEHWSGLPFPYYRIIALISHASKVMLKILQARLQQYVNRELPDVQAGFRKGRGTRDQIANIR